MVDVNPATQLIAVEIEHPEFVQLLNDIRDFDWPIINRLRKVDLDRVASTGFRFSSKGLENQRMELKQFLFNHPSCMASDFEMIVNKLLIFSQLWSSKTKVETFTPIENKQPALKYGRRKKPKVIVVEEETDYESEEDYEEEEEVKPKRRRGRKSRN